MYGPAEISRDLTAVRDGRATFESVAALEHHLVMVLRHGGHAALESLLASLPDFSFLRSPTDDPDTWLYASDTPGGTSLLITAFRGPHSTTLDVATERPAPRPPADARHRVFYETWEDLIGVERIEDLDPPRRAVFLVASLEADLMNGGFGQYLDNSADYGEAHLEATLQCLDRIGASGTARLLRRAASARDAARSSTEEGADADAALRLLDADLLELREDLAGLTFDAFLDPSSANEPS